MMKTFKRYFLKFLAFFLVFYLLKFLFPTAFGFINVNASANSVSSGMNYFIYNIDEASPTKNGTKPFATTGSTIVFPFSSYTNENFGFGYQTIQFLTTAPNGSKSALGYTITATFQILFDGLQNNMGNTSYTGWVRFNDGMIVNEVSSVELIGLTSGSGTFKITTTAQLTNTTNLNNMTISLSGAKPFGFAGYGDTFTVQLVLKDVVIQYAENENSAILNSLNQNQKETNKKLDEVKEEIKKNNQEQKNTNDLIENTDTTGANSSGNDFFDNFNSGSNGDLTSLVSLPLNYINHLNDKCEPFTLPLGKFGNVSIPCLSSIWSSSGFSNIISIISAIINGLICYKVGLNLLFLFNNLRDPDNDKLEVMDL